MSNEALKIVYVVGASRSGSTLLDILLGRMNGAIPVGELFPIWERGVLDNQLCGCGEKLPLCSFWGKVFSKMGIIDLTSYANDRNKERKKVEGLLNFPKVFLSYLLGLKFKHVLRYIGSSSLLLDSIAQISKKSLIIDSSKDPSRAVALAMDPDLRKRLYIIHLVRDCRAVAYSRSKKKRRKEITDRIEYLVRRGPLWCSFSWIFFNIFSMLIKFVVPQDRFCLLRYEDLASNPDYTMEKLSRFLEESSGNNVEQILSGDSSEEAHTAAGNPMRLDSIKDIRVDDEWMRKMGAIPKYFSTLVSSPLLILFKYRLFKSN